MKKNKKSNILIFLGILVLGVISAIFIYPVGYGADNRPWRLGLDLVGGSHLVYEIDMSKVDKSDWASVHEGLRNVIERRVNTFGVSEPLVFTAKEGNSFRVIVEIAGIKDVNQAIAQIGKTAFLDFRKVQVVQDTSANNNPKPTPKGTLGDLTSASSTANEPKVAYLETGLTGKALKSARVEFDQFGKPDIAISFNSEGSALFEKITGDNIGQQIAIFLDGNMISAPVVNQKIVGGNAVITGNFTIEEAQSLASLLNAGALPAPANLISQQTVNATLGLNSLSRALYAGLLGTIVVMLFMIMLYRSLGVYSAIALLIYLLLALAIFKFVPITMTLSGIAGFILSIGMAVDANILIFERTKEELAKGLSRIASIEYGFQRAWPSIRDSNITTILSTVILYSFSSSFVRGFALTLLLGVLVSMFSAIVVTRTMLRLFIGQKE